MEPKNRLQGFTLVEVMFVIAVIGILSAVAIPTYLTWLPDMRLKATARDVYSTFQKTRLDAIKTNRDLAIVFNPLNNTYSICSDPGVDGIWSTVDGSNTVLQVNNFTQAGYGIGYGNGGITGLNSVTKTAMPANSVSFNNNVLVLNSRGTGNNGYIYLQNQNNRVYAVGSTSRGAIRLRQWMGGSWK